MNKIDSEIRSTSPTLAYALSILASTSRIVGAGYFPIMVEGLAKALGVRWAFVCNFDAARPEEATTIAFWDNGPAENFVYQLLNTPCADVASQGVCCFADDIAKLYPLDQLLIDMGARSYAGKALHAEDGRVLGLIAILDEKPFPDAKTVEEVVGLFSGRAAAELERLATGSLNERLGRIVESSVSEAYVFDSVSYRFELVNRGARENLGYSMKELQTLTPWDLKPEYTKEQFISFVQPLIDGKVPSLKFETIHKRKNLTTYPVWVQLQYFPDAGGVFFASITDITDRKRREENEKLILKEMNHRTKNVLAVVQAIIRQSAKADPENFVTKIETRIAALASSHDILVRNSWQDILIGELIRSQMGHFAQLIEKRIILSGPPLKIRASAAQGFGLALHELSTNAAKYGALSNDEGIVMINWESTGADTENPTLTFSWQEKQGPRVVAPTSTGFGSYIIQKTLEFQFDCDVDMKFDPAGLTCTVRLPLRNLISI